MYDGPLRTICGTHMTSIFEGQPPQNKAFSNQNKGDLGSRYIYIHITSIKAKNIWLFWEFPQLVTPGDVF